MRDLTRSHLLTLPVTTPAQNAANDVNTHALALSIARQATSQGLIPDMDGYQDALVNLITRELTPLVSSLSFPDALRIARGCLDYNGGYRLPNQLEVYHHGIETVITALEAAAKQGLEDTQVAALHAMGNTSAPTPADPQPAFPGHITFPGLAGSIPPALVAKMRHALEHGATEAQMWKMAAEYLSDTS